MLYTVNMEDMMKRLELEHTINTTTPPQWDENEEWVEALDTLFKDGTIDLGAALDLTRNGSGSNSESKDGHS